jgi:hypothetical protein
LNEPKQATSSSILRQLFGESRAEFPASGFGNLFVQPAYLSKLESARPCFLVGGRGTGKTTSLQALHYKSAQTVDSGSDDRDYFGVLVRMNKNRVRAFEGSGATDLQWRKLFAHYFNLLVCLELTLLTKWLEDRSGVSLSESSIELICQDLGLRSTDTVTSLEAEIRHGISALQLLVNNPRKPQEIALSIAESPLKTFVQQLHSANLLGRPMVFCCIDEFENLLDYQQSVLNTYIKHAEPPLSYKVGVRKNGVRNRHTLDGDDLLRAPDDFAEIEIAEEGFELFAIAVAELRLKSARQAGLEVPQKLGEFLEELTLEKEAELLGATRVAANVMTHLSSAPSDVRQFFQAKSAIEVAFLQYWHDTDRKDILELARDWYENEKSWQTRFGNYAYASLFSLSRGNKGARIRKYYCGERVLLSLAAGNIRYFLELIENAIAYQISIQAEWKGQLSISPQNQTLAARDVGERRLQQLEGLADRGVQLKRLVLAIGKVFFELARAPSGKAPEVTSFVLNGGASDRKEVTELLSEGVGHLAFEVDPRTKATTHSEIRDEEFRLHRIFCAFFEISHRKKRRMTFDAKDLLGVLQDNPSRAISALLGNSHQTAEDQLPEQLAFFSAFYEDSKAG